MDRPKASVHAAMILNALRALAVPDEELRAHSSHVASIERLVVEELQDRLAVARDLEAQGRTVIFPKAVWGSLVGLDRLLAELVDMIYTPGCDDPAVFSARWRDAKSLAAAMIAMHGWQGAVDWSLFEN